MYDIGDKVIFVDDNIEGNIISTMVNINITSMNELDFHLYLVNKDGIIDWYDFRKIISLTELRKIKIEKLICKF